MKLTLLLLITVACYGCSNKAIYENMQSNERLECNKLPQPQQQECVDRLEMSFEEYEQEKERPAHK